VRTLAETTGTLRPGMWVALKSASVKADLLITFWQQGYPLPVSWKKRNLDFSVFPKERAAQEYLMDHQFCLMD
jgi:hypothetical protein